MLYMALCSPNYPERHIYAAINQLRDHLNKLGDYETEPDVLTGLSSPLLSCTAGNLFNNFARISRSLKALTKLELLEVSSTM